MWRQLEVIYLACYLHLCVNYIEQSLPFNFKFSAYDIRRARFDNGRRQLSRHLSKLNLFERLGIEFTTRQDSSLSERTTGQPLLAISITF